jgi:hypothetical protein
MPPVRTKKTDQVFRITLGCVYYYAALRPEPLGLAGDADALLERIARENHLQLVVRLGSLYEFVRHTPQSLKTFIVDLSKGSPFVGFVRKRTPGKVPISAKIDVFFAVAADSANHPYSQR